MGERKKAPVFPRGLSYILRCNRCRQSRIWVRLVFLWAAIYLPAFAFGLAAVVPLFNKHHMIDLEVYRAGALSLLHGEDVSQSHPSNSTLPFTYPPFAALVFTPLAVIGAAAAQVVIIVLSVTTLAVIIRLTLHALNLTHDTQTDWTTTAVLTGAALLIEPVRATLALGQINLALVALIMIDVLLAAEKSRQGMLVGLATGVKLTPGIFILYFLVTRRWRPALTACMTMAVTVVVGLIVAPQGSYHYWFRAAFDPSHIGGVEFAGNQSWNGLVTRISGGLNEWQILKWLGLAAVLIGGLMQARKAYLCDDDLSGACISAIVGLLISPISWNHHWVWVVPITLILFSRPGPARVAGLFWLATFTLAPIWWVPYEGHREYTQHGIQILAGNAYVLAGLLLLVGSRLLTRKSLGNGRLDSVEG